MTLTITLTANAQTGAGVDFNAGYTAYFSDYVPYGMPWFLGPTSAETTQIVHLDTPVAGQESATRAVLVEGSDFVYTMADHTVSGTIDTIRLTTLGPALDATTGEFVLNGGVITTAVEYITISGLGLTNAPHVRGDVHNLIKGLMGGGLNGTEIDVSLLTQEIWSQGHDLQGSTGGDSYVGTDYADLVQGYGGNDSLSGGAGADRIWGGSGADVISGGMGRDVLYGGMGADRILGGMGNDKLIGGMGRDTLDGGAGADRFVYLAASDSTAAQRDKILSFATGTDTVDLAALAPGDDSLSWIGTDGFSGAEGELRWSVVGQGVLVEADLDGDSTADFALLLAGITEVTEQDFLL